MLKARQKHVNSHCTFLTVFLKTDFVTSMLALCKPINGQPCEALAGYNHRSPGLFCPGCDISNKVFSATTARFSSLTEKEKGNFSAVSYFNGSFHSEYTALVLMDFFIYFRLESKWVGVLAYCYLFCFFNLVILIHFYTKTIF